MNQNPIRMMPALLLYSYINRIYSSRQIAAATYERVDLRVLTGDQHPFHTVVNELRLRHLGAPPQRFVQVLKLCDRAGLLKLEHVSLDGSKGKVNASKHKAMSHGRMESEVERMESSSSTSSLISRVRKAAPEPSSPAKSSQKPPIPAITAPFSRIRSANP